MTASTATAALRARRRHQVTHVSPLFTPAGGLGLVDELDPVSRAAIDRQFVLEAQGAHTPVAPVSFDELGRWQDAQFTALQQAVEEAFTEAVHDLVRPYVDPARRGSTGPLPVVTEVGSVPPPTIAQPGVRGRGAEVEIDLDLDDQPTRPIARTAPSRRELRSRQRDRERARVVLARKVATGGVLAMAAISTVAVAGPKMLQRLGTGGTSADAELNLAASLAPRSATAPTTQDTVAAAKSSALTTVSDASRGAGAAVVQLMQAQITAEAAEQARLQAAAARQAAAQKASRSSSRAAASSDGGSGSSGSSGSGAAGSGGSGKTPDSARAIAQGLMSGYGWSSSQFQCLNLLWNRESGWKYTARNPSSGAYGIPQALPGSKMGSVASDWRTNPRTQIVWGLGYIKSRYGTPCAAWSHSEATNWY